MEMQEVRYFIALCEEQNFTRAARRCGVSQPSLTLAIKKLEAELGGPLFQRNRTISRLSPLGSMVRPYLAAVEGAVIGAKREADAFLNTSEMPLPFNVNPILPFKPKENPMRKIVIGAVIAATMLLVVGLTIRAPQPAGASAPAEAKAASDVYAIEAKIDVKALPRYDVVSEAEE
jgi:Bacterial regulatory helix-turn-helix protein, lysR family